jgi:hypothetical protein
VLLLQVPHTSITDPVLTAVPAIAALLALATIPMVRRSILRPLPPGIKEPEARLQSAGAYRTATFAVFAIAEAPALLGYALAFTAESAAPYLFPFLVAEALLFAYALPRPATVDDATERLEAAGAKSYLWESLTGSAKP